MKYLGLLILYFGCVIVVHSQVGPDKSGVRMDAGLDKHHADLQLTTSILDQRYCTDERLRFTLRFTFKNAGGKTIILDKRSSIVPRFTISRNAELASSGKHQMVVNTLIGISGDPMTLDPVPNESQFTILRVGESHSRDEGFSIPFDGKELQGAYVLQLTVLTWHYPRASNIEWREKWRNKGYLWTNSVTSEPMPFTIEKKHSQVQCF